MDLFAVDQKQLRKRLTLDNKLLNKQFKPIQFIDQFFKTNPFMLQKKKIQEAKSVPLDQNRFLSSHSRPELNLAEITSKQRPSTQLISQNTERSNRLGINMKEQLSLNLDMQQNNYKTYLKSKLLPEKLKDLNNHPTSRSLVILKKPSFKQERIKFEDIDLNTHLDSLQRYNPKSQANLVIQEKPEEFNVTDQTLKNVNLPREGLNIDMNLVLKIQKPLWKSDKVDKIDKKFCHYIRTKQKEMSQASEVQEKELPILQKSGTNRSSIDIQERRINQNKQFQALFQFYLSCIFAEQIYKKKFSTGFLLREFVRQTQKDLPNNVKKHQDLVDTDLLFHSLVANIHLLQSLVQSQKAVNVVLMKIPGFSINIKSLLFKLKPNKSILDDRQVFLLKENLTALQLMVEYIIGFDNTVPQYQVEAMQELIIQGSGLFQLLALPQRQKTTKKFNMDTMSIMEQMMPITQNHDTMMSYVKELNLDIDFIKTLFYYNKNLEEYVEILLHESALLKNQQIEARKEKVSKSINTYLNGSGLSSQIRSQDIKKTTIDNLLNEYKYGQKSQILYNSHILSQLQLAENNTGSYSRVTMGSRLVFQNINEQALSYRQ